MLVLLKNIKKQKETTTVTIWQKNRLEDLIKKRIAYIKKTGVSTCVDEIELLQKAVKALPTIKNWSELKLLSKDSRIYNILSVSIMDALYTKELAEQDDKKDFLLNLYLLDMLNEGVEYNGQDYVFMPEGLNIKKTIELILNGQESFTEEQKEMMNSKIAKEWERREPKSFQEFKTEIESKPKENYFSPAVVKKVIDEMNKTEGINKLSYPSKYVIAKTIIEVLSNSIYNHSHNILTKNEKLYIRILYSIISGKTYESAFQTLQTQKKGN